MKSPSRKKIFLDKQESANQLYGDDLGGVHIYDFLSIRKVRRAVNPFDKLRINFLCGETGAGECAPAAAG